MEPVKSRGSKDRIDKRKVPGGDGNLFFSPFIYIFCLIDKRKVPGGDGNLNASELERKKEKIIDKRKVPGGDGNSIRVFLFSIIVVINR